MSHARLKCVDCGTTHGADMLTLRCRQCHGCLRVEYVAGAGTPLRLQGTAAAPMPLPLHGDTSGLLLCDTPCVALPWAARRLGLRGVVAKLEFASPSGSFKDRGAAVLMAAAVEQGVEAVVEDSSGNAGAAMAAYAARAGVAAHVFAPAAAPAAKLAQIRMYGARVHAIEGSREAVAAAAVAFANEHGLVYASHNLSPYFLEGTKSFAYEVATGLGHDAPTSVVFPVGNGSLLLGAAIGFEEQRRGGALRRIPRLHCVQARAVMPIVAAFHGERWQRDPDARVVAGGIAVGEPPRLREVVDAVRRSGGSAVAVDDEAILGWHTLLAEREGIYAEPTSAAAFAGLEELVRRGLVEGEETVLVPVTGSGLKDAAPTPEVG